MKAADVAKGIQQAASDPVKDRIFRDRGEQRYSFELLPAGITFEVDRLCRRSHELWGELSVSVNGSFPHAKTIEGGLLSIGDLNFSSVQARGTRAKILADRSRTDTLDWHGFLEEFAVKILATERRGKPASVLADEPEAEERAETWDIDGFPLLQDEPTVLFGLGESAKSYFAMYLAGRLAIQGINVLYADWEFSLQAHRKRLGKLFQPMPKNVFYARCDRPLEAEIDRLVHLVHKHECRYVVCDSMMFALAGRADEEQAGIYFRACRQFKIGSLHVAHTSKSSDESQEQKSIFGSVFFGNGARSIWFIQRAEDSPRGSLQFGLFHRKNNLGEKLKPKGYKLVFTHDTTTVEKVSVEDVDELAAKLPLLDRMRRALKKQALSIKALAETTDCTAGTARKMVSKYSTVFVRIGDKVGLLSENAKVDF